MTASTYALIDCWVAKWVSESLAILSSSLIAVPLTPVFKTGLVKVLFVNVSVDVSVTIEPSVAIDTLLSVTVVVTPEPPSNINVSPNATASDVELSSLIVIVELDNFAFVILPASFDVAIEPANIVFVTEPVSPVPTKVPVDVGILIKASLWLILFDAGTVA